MIEELKYLEAISVIEEITTDGHSPLKVLCNDFSQYYIKNSSGKAPNYTILNEFVCHYLLRLWNIPTPDIAAILLLPERLPEDLSERHKKHFYHTLTFGSKKVENSTELNSFLSGKKINLNQFVNPEVIVRIGLFDIWVENTDRKPTNMNLLIAEKGKKFEFYAIDNAFTFDTLAYRDLYFGITNTWDQSILNTDLARVIVKTYLKQGKWIDSLRDYFYICIAGCQQHFDEIVNNLPKELCFDELKEDLRSFLFNENRNKLVFEELIARLI